MQNNNNNNNDNDFGSVQANANDVSVSNNYMVTFNILIKIQKYLNNLQDRSMRK